MKKPAKTKKQQIPQKKQWFVVSGLVFILFVFAFVVYAADVLWLAAR